MSPSFHQAVLSSLWVILGSYTSYHVTATPYFANARDFTSDDVTWLHYKNVDEEVFNLPVTNSAPVVVSRLD